MANEYHDAAGRFCSKDDMKRAIADLAIAGDHESAQKLIADLKRIEEKRNQRAFVSSQVRPASKIAPPANESFALEAAKAASAASFGVNTEAEDSPWNGSPFRDFYDNKNGKQRGKWGERYAAFLLEKAGLSVSTSKDTSYDLEVEGKRIEVKTNGSDYSGSSLKVNWCQIRPAQSYDYILGVTVSPQEVVLHLVPAHIVKQRIVEGLIPNQHGGKNVDSGAYLLKGKVQEWLQAHRVSVDQISDVLQGAGSEREESAA